MSRAQRFVLTCVMVGLVLGLGLVWWLGREARTVAKTEPSSATVAQAAEPPVDLGIPLKSETEVTPIAAKNTLASTLPTVTGPSPVAPPVPSSHAAAGPGSSALAVATPHPIPEVEATRRMYAAHAPLRVPEVANPDSEANRKILTSMVQKALARAQAAPVQKD